MALPPKQITCASCKKRSDCFNELSKSDHLLIEDHRVELKFNKGEIICKQGSFASSIMFIYSGVAITYLETSNSNRVGLNILPAGKMIGLPSLFTDPVYQHSASAIEDCVICSIDIKVFEAFTKSNGGFASEIIRTLNGCMQTNFERMVGLSYKQLNGRLAETILYLAENIYQQDRFNMSLSRKDLADLTAMSPESVTRIVSGFVSDGLIKVRGKSYEVLNKEQLRLVSERG
jgi:CRP/FNR family transcriptional regulator